MKSSPDSGLGGNTAGIANLLGYSGGNGYYDPTGGYGEFLGGYATPTSEVDPYMPTAAWDEGYGTQLHNISYGPRATPAVQAVIGAMQGQNPAVTRPTTTPATTTPASNASANPAPYGMDPGTQAGFSAAVQNSFANPLIWNQYAQLGQTQQQYDDWVKQQADPGSYSIPTGSYRVVQGAPTTTAPTTTPTTTTTPTNTTPTTPATTVDPNYNRRGRYLPYGAGSPSSLDPTNFGTNQGGG